MSRLLGLVCLLFALDAWSYDFSPYCPNKVNGFNKFQRKITDGLPTPFVEKHRQYQKDQASYDVIIFGDSMVERWDREAYNRYLKPQKVGLFGISGDQVEHVLWRLEQGELKAQNPKLVILWYGINNAGINKDIEIAEGIKRGVELIRTQFPKAKVAVMNLFPAGKEAKTGYRRQIRCVNQKLQQLGIGELAIQLGQHVLTAQGLFDAPMTVDHLHLSHDGYMKITPMLLTEIASLLSDKS